MRGGDSGNMQTPRGTGKKQAKAAKASPIRVTIETQTDNSHDESIVQCNKYTPFPKTINDASIGNSDYISKAPNMEIQHDKNNYDSATPFNYHNERLSDLMRF